MSISLWSTFIISIYSIDRIRYSLAEGHGLHRAMQILYFGDSWITPWPDMSERVGHLHCDAFLPFLNIVGPLIRRYFKPLIFTCLIRRSLFSPPACVRCAWGIARLRSAVLAPPHRSYKTLANKKALGLPAERQWVHINEGRYFLAMWTCFWNPPFQTLAHQSSAFRIRFPKTWLWCRSRDLRDLAAFNKYW